MSRKPLTTEQKAKEIIQDNIDGKFLDVEAPFDRDLMEQILVDFANSLTNLDKVDPNYRHPTMNELMSITRIDEEGNVLSEPLITDKKYLFDDDGRTCVDENLYQNDLEQYQQAQTISERLQSDKEKYLTLKLYAEGLHDLANKTNIKDIEYVKQLQAKVSSWKTEALSNEEELTQSKAEIERLTQNSNKLYKQLEIEVRHLKANGLGTSKGTDDLLAELY